MNVHEIEPSSDAKDYTVFSSAIDLVSESAKGEPAHLLYIVAGGGTITVKTQGSGSTQRTYTCAAGDVFILRIMSIDSVSGVTRVRAQWP